MRWVSVKANSLIHQMEKEHVLPIEDFDRNKVQIGISYQFL